MAYDYGAGYGGGMLSGGIAEFLKRLAYPSGGAVGAGAVRPRPNGLPGLGGGAYAPGAGVRPFAGLQPPLAAPAVAPEGPSPFPGFGSDEGSPYSAFGPQAPAPTLKQLPGLGGPATKTEPRAPLSFAWKGDALKVYDPEGPGLADAATKASRARGFMGHPGLTSFPEPMTGGEPGPGFTPSETNWENVANPMAFEGYRQRPEIAALERASKDPLWAEREKAGIEGQRDIGIAQATVAAQAASVKAAEQQRQQQIEGLAQSWIERKNKELAAAGKPPLDLAGENDLYMQAAQRLGQRMF